VELVESTPAPVPPAPESMFEKRADHAQLSPAEKLGRNLDTALDVDPQIMALGVDADNLKQARLVGEASGRTLSTPSASTRRSSAAKIIASKISTSSPVCCVKNMTTSGAKTKGHRS
jgi:hypothetical protein